MAESNCIRCNREVQPRQFGIEYNTCHFWQHSTCETVITLEQYRQAVTGELQLQWRCIPCSDKSETHAIDATADISMGLATHVAESTRLSLPGLVHGNTLQSFEQDMQMYKADSASSIDDDSSFNKNDSSP